MINMENVRFENTYLALCECYEAILDRDDISDSEREFRYAQLLKEKCQEFINDFNL